MKPQLFRLDVLAALCLSLGVLMIGKVWLSLLWGFVLHRMTISRWEQFSSRQLQVSFGRKFLCLAGILLAAGVANILCTVGGILSAHQASDAALLALGCAGVVLFGGALVVSRFVNRTWTKT